MLQRYQHNCGEGDDPQECISVFRTCSKITCPVARIYEAYSNQKPRSNVFENIQTTQDMGMVLVLKFFDNIHPVKIRYGSGLPPTRPSIPAPLTGKSEEVNS